MGTVGRLYYTYVTQDNGLCLRPAVPLGDETFWFDLPPLRIGMAEELTTILSTLANSTQPLTAADLLEQLQDSNVALFSSMKLGELKGLYLNKLDPRYVQRSTDNTNQVTKDDHDLLNALAATNTSISVNQPASLIKLDRLEDAQQLLAGNHANP